MRSLGSSEVKSRPAVSDSQGSKVETPSRITIHVHLRSSVVSISRIVGATCLLLLALAPLPARAACQLGGSCAGKADGTTCDAGTDGAVLTCASGECGVCVPIGTCSLTTATACAFSTQCPGGETCNLGPDPSPRYVENGDGTVTDRRTCLVWEQKTGTADFELNVDCSKTACPNPHVVNNRYDWCLDVDDDGICDNPGNPPDGGAFTDFLAKLNSGSFAGHADWRLPTSGGIFSTPSGEPAELESICGPSLCTFGIAGTDGVEPAFRPTAPDFYWAATTFVPNPTFGHLVFFDYFETEPIVNVGSKTHDVHARAVRGGSGAPVDLPLCTPTPTRTLTQLQTPTELPTTTPVRTFTEAPTPSAIPTNTVTASLGGLIVDALEVTQAVQDLDNHVRLVAGKPTFVRLHVYSEGAPQLVTATLEVSLRGSMQTLRPVENKIWVKPRLERMRSIPNHAFLFQLPTEFIGATGNLDSDKLELTGRIRHPDSGQAADSFMTAKVAFEAVPPMQLRYYHTTYRIEEDPFTVFTGKLHQERLFSWLQRAFPIGRLDGSVRVLRTFDEFPSLDFEENGEITRGLGCVIVNAELSRQRARDLNGNPNVPEQTRYYAMVNDAGGFMRGCGFFEKSDLVVNPVPTVTRTFGAGTPSPAPPSTPTPVPTVGAGTPSPTTASSPVLSVNITALTGSGPTGIPGGVNDRTGMRPEDWDTDGSYGDWYGGHELGHMFARSHVACKGGNASAPDLSFPNPDGSIGPGSDETSRAAVFGFDSGFNGVEQIYPPSLWKDVMTYCPRQWISDYTTHGLMDQMQGKEGVCADVTDVGRLCTANAGCASLECSPRKGVCVGGTGAGDACTDKSPCPSGGTCTPSGRCVGGPLADDVCTSQSHCAPGECRDAGRCVGGADAGNVCTDKTPCAGNGTCQPDGLCAGVSDVGKACSGPLQCASRVCKLAGGAAAAFDEPVDRLLVVGAIDVATGYVYLEPLFVLPDAGDLEPRVPGDYAIVLLDAAARELARYSFAAAEVVGEYAPQPGEPERTLLFFSELVPYVEGTARVDIEGPAGVLESVTAGMTPPEIEIVSPNGGEELAAENGVLVEWTASDADGDPLTFDVEYSTDDGETWRAVAQSITDTEVVVDAMNLVGSSQARFRVWASDGIHTSGDESDGILTVENQSPSAEIVVPADDTVVVAGMSLGFEGTAIDDSGILNGEQIQWQSSRDGVIGSGPSIAVATLSVGSHTITMVADDGDGGTGEDSVEVLVVADPSQLPTPADALQVGPPVLLFRGVLAQSAVAVDNANLEKPIAWSGVSSEPWVALEMTGGTTPAHVRVSYDPGDMAPGTYRASLTFTTPDVPGQSVVIGVEAVVPPCAGDCDLGGTVTDAELIEGITLALGVGQPGQCPAFDVSGDGRVTVDELVQAVGNKASACAR